MGIVRFDISDFRNILSARVEPDPNGFNIIYGNNGSGKTSLLEAIYYLSFGRSFRSPTSAHIIRKSANKLAVHSFVRGQNDQQISVGIERLSDGKLNARMAGKDINSIAEIANLLPVQLINANSFSLLDAGPNFRRRYLDWGVFHHSSDFLRIWRQFKRVLKQRNAALANNLPKKELDTWNNEVAECALAIHSLRLDYIDQLLPVLKTMVSELLMISDLNIKYYAGWDDSIDYKTVLSQSLVRDMQLGYTQFGPHRANFNITTNRLPAKDILSRGQQKLFVCAMILAQGALLYRGQNKRPIYLVDDLPSELDVTSRSNLIALLSKQEAQIFVTTVEREAFDSRLMTKPVKLFHVEHGKLKHV